MADNSRSVAEAVSLSRQLFGDRRNSRFWPGPLVRQLERKEPKLALRWAILLFQELVSTRRRTGLESQQQEWLAKLVSLMERDDDPDSCNKIAFEIWNNDPDVNLVERGIARLYWALQNYLIGLMEPDYYLQVGAAVALLGDNGKSVNDMDEQTFERGTVLFHHLSGRIS
jgi:hypothetical protein